MTIKTRKATRKTEAGPSGKSANRVWIGAMQCRHRQTESRAPHSFLMNQIDLASTDGAHASLPRPAWQNLLSHPGDCMFLSTVPQPVDDDLVQRLREKGGL